MTAAAASAAFFDEDDARRAPPEDDGDAHFGRGDDDAARPPRDFVGEMIDKTKKDREERQAWGERLAADREKLDAGFKELAGLLEFREGPGGTQTAPSTRFLREYPRRGRGVAATRLRGEHPRLVSANLDRSVRAQATT